MSERLTNTAEIIEYKGVKILFNDYSGLKGKELAEAIKGTSKAMIPKTASGKRDWLSVSVFTDSFFDEAAMKSLIKVRKAMTNFFIAIADVGLTQVQTVAMNLAGSLSESTVLEKKFDTVDQAKEWLVEVHRKSMKKE